MQAARHRIRTMRAADLEAILRIQAASYPPAMREPGTVVLARMACARDTCIVAEDDGGLCAYLFAYRSRLGEITPLDGMFKVAADADTLYLHDLSVAPRAQRRGLARLVVGYALERARVGGLAMSALVSVQDSAGFWAGMGYRGAGLRCPRARAALAGYPGQACYMVRAL